MAITTSNSMSVNPVRPGGANECEFFMGSSY